MSKCFDHKTTFPDTHRHFCLAIEISRKFPIVCEGLELKQSSLKTKHAWIRSPWMIIFKFTISEQIVFGAAMLKSNGDRMHSSEFKLHLNRAFERTFLLYLGYKNTLFAFLLFLFEIHISMFIFFSYINTKTLYNIYIHIYIFICTYIYKSQK